MKRICRRARSLVLLIILPFGCADGSAQAPSKGPVAHPTIAASSALSRASPAAVPSPPAAVTTKHEDPAAVFERVKPALTQCYETGRASTPTMIDGKLTLNASVEASGKITCVIPTDDAGLTQEVEDCMSSKLAATQLADSSAAWQIRLPVQIKGGAVQSGTASASSSSIESVETHRMPDAFDALEGLVPELQACLRDVDRSGGSKQVIIGARVNTDGRTACALATGVPLNVTDCATQLFMRTTFPAPRGGMGLILVPVTLTKR